MKIIWHEADGEYFDVSNNAFRRFRKDFVLASSANENDPVIYQIKIACSGKYLLYVNGTYIGRGPVRYDRRWPEYDVLDISGIVRPGSNTIATLCLYQGYGTGQSMVSPPGLVFELNGLGNEDSHQSILVSDESWKSSKALAFNSDAPRINGRQGIIEIFDARLDEPDWVSPGFDDSNWHPVRVHKHALMVSHFWNLAPRDIPLLNESRQAAIEMVATGTGDRNLLPSADNTKNIWRHMQTFLCNAALVVQETGPRIASSPTETDQARLEFYEFSKLYAGYFQLRISGSAGQIVDCIYLESLPPMQQNRLDLEGSITSENRPMDRFILQQGDNNLEVAFGWKAFRYVILVIHPAPSVPEIHEVSIRTREYPFIPINHFTSSDHELNRIFDICQHTTRICTQDGFVDSPSREQQQWIGDGRWTALVFFHLTGDSRLYKKMLIQIGQSQDHTGMIKPRHPDDHNNIPPIPAFALSWLAAFYEYYLHTGDLKLAEEWWPNMERVLVWFSHHENNEGVLEDVPGWFFIDWGRPPQIMDVRRGGMVAALNLQYIEALLFSAELCYALGNLERAYALRNKASRLQDACSKIFWSQNLGAYVDCSVNGGQSTTISEQTNALALLFLHGNGPYAAINSTRQSVDHADRIKPVMRNVFKPSWKPGENEEQLATPVPCSPFYMIRHLQAMSLHGKHKLALDVLKARYRIFLQAGSTTTWEKWELYRHDDHGHLHKDSASHGWGAAPVLFFFNELLGISPLKPGYQDYAFTPHLAGMTHLSGEFQLPGNPTKLIAQIFPTERKLTRL